MENLKKTMKDVLENNILNYWIHKVKDEGPFLQPTGY